MALTPGTELGGFRIESLIRRGGMGVVYLAQDVRLGRRVALKVLAPELVGDSDFQTRFIAESERAASIDHPNIIPIYAAGEADGHLFIAMRYVPGRDLAEVLREEGRIAPERIIRIIEQVAEALDAAHAEGLIHRDVKPANILLAGAVEREHVYLVDFGLTKRATASAGFTRTGQLVGTLAYISPEQIKGEQIDGRTDQYSLACVLYECLSGVPPYAGETDATVMFGHLSQPIPALPGDIPGAAELQPVIERGMAKRLEDRYPTTLDLARDVRRRWNARRDEANTVVVASPADPEEPPVPPPTTPPPPAVPSGGARRPARIGIAIGVIALILAVVGSVVALGVLSPAASPSPRSSGVAGGLPNPSSPSTAAPVASASSAATRAPGAAQTDSPTEAATSVSTDVPSDTPSDPPTDAPTDAPIGSPPASPVPTNAAPLTLRVGTSAEVTTWDPLRSFETEALYLANVYEPLLWTNPPGAAEPFRPALATSWEASEDGLVWTFSLREGVSFHDGVPLTADAVVRSIQAVRERGGPDSAAFIWAPLSDIAATDELTVQMTLAYAAPMDLVASSLYGAWIVSPSALEAAASDESYFETGIDAGTGPYTIESYTPNSEVVLTRYDDYWGGWDDVRHYDEVRLSIFSDAVSQQQALDDGIVDIALSIPLENIDAYRDDPDFTVLEEPSLFSYVGLFNTQRAPLDNPLVRRALSYATPYQEIVDVAARGYGTQSRGPVPAGVFPHSGEVPQYTYDLDTARQLLAQAEREEGFPVEITFDSDNEFQAALAPLLRDSYGQIGVDVTLTPMPFEQQWDRAKGDVATRQDMFLAVYWPTYSDAGSDNLYSLFSGSDGGGFFNLSNWSNAQYDALIDEASTLTATDRDTARARYVEAMQLLVDEAPGVFLFDSMFVIPFPNGIAGYEYNLNYPFAHLFYPLHPAQ